MSNEMKGEKMEGINNENVEELKKDPIALMTVMMIESSIETRRQIVDLVNKYKSANVDVIPINEIEECFVRATDKSVNNDSLLKKILNTN